MQKYLIALESVTYAMKAKQVLNLHNINCEVQRTPKTLSSGCGYSIRTSGDFEYIKEILEKSGIRLKKVMEVGGNLG